MGIFKKLFKRKEQPVIFLLISWNSVVPEIIKKSTNSTILYKMMELDKPQEVITLKEYEEII